MVHDSISSLPNSLPFRGALSPRVKGTRAPIPERVGRLPARVKLSTTREGRRERTPHLETRCKQPRLNLEREKASKFHLSTTATLN